jgi:peptidoglycan/xylan/chitin deacetylase (PgdA/CDA1 family)
MVFWPGWMETVLWRSVEYIGRLGRRSIPVLVYHSIDEEGGLGSISPDLFRQHLRYLADHGYVGLKCSELMTSLDWRHGTRSVALTFDDGYRNFSEEVVPLLSEFGFAATVFPVINKIGGVSDWGRLKNVPIRSLMDWSELRAAAKAGIEIGSHGLGHRYLLDCSSAELEREVNESKRQLEEGLGQEVSTFCYPYGAYNGKVLRAVRGAGYKQACAGRYALCTSGTTPFEIPRMAMDIFRYHGDRGMRIFPACLNGGSRLYVSLRNLILRPPKRYDRPTGI